jgi:hypothetical protein
MNASGWYLMRLDAKELVNLCIYCWGHPLLYIFSGSVAVWILLSGNLKHQGSRLRSFTLIQSVHGGPEDALAFHIPPSTLCQEIRFPRGIRSLGILCPAMAVSHDLELSDVSQTTTLRPSQARAS